ncbi:hypothetical protein ACFXHA_25610 [Nocardia sp. NPDC059240]|uniref:hypothetical protein n=1 Tax=Nocardia sp. NPDC059240 TaxID=3346786 RepID=UPI0036A8964B
MPAASAYDGITGQLVTVIASPNDPTPIPKVLTDNSFYSRYCLTYVGNYAVAVTNDTNETLYVYGDDSCTVTNQVAVVQPGESASLLATPGWGFTFGSPAYAGEDHVPF